MKSNSISDYCCSFCDSSNLELVMDFGKVALAGGFLKPEQYANEVKYPMRLCFCVNCYAVQIIDKISPDVLFQDYFYFSSSITSLKNHFKQYADEVVDRFIVPANASVLEFGCNDGVLLLPLADLGIKNVIGVDPAENVVSIIDDPRVTIVNDYFTESVAQQVMIKHGPMDLIMANNVYAHIPDIQGTTRAIKGLLADDGVFVFEVHYLGCVVEDMQYDMIYHEHLYYYSVLSATEHFKIHGMTVFDVEKVPIHAGSLRFFVCKNDSKHASSISKEVTSLAQAERDKGYDKIDMYLEFSGQVEETKHDLISLLQDLKKQGFKIAGYGASGRANTMIQYCNIGNDLIDFMIDDAPAKLGYHTPGSHFEVVPSSVLAQPDAPDYVLVFAWSFFEEIVKRNEDYLAAGGKMILPLPKIQIYSASE